MPLPNFQENPSSFEEFQHIQKASLLERHLQFVLHPSQQFDEVTMFTSFPREAQSSISQQTHPEVAETEAHPETIKSSESFDVVGPNGSGYKGKAPSQQQHKTNISKYGYQGSYYRHTGRNTGNPLQPDKNGQGGSSGKGGEGGGGGSSDSGGRRGGNGGGGGGPSNLATTNVQENPLQMALGEVTCFWSCVGAIQTTSDSESLLISGSVSVIFRGA